MIFVDSNVLIDVIEGDPVWREWSIVRIEDAAEAGRVVINHIVLAEAAPRSGPLDQFRDSLEVMMIAIEPYSDEAAYAAGSAFQNYRQRRRAADRLSILPDFLIGAHALTIGATILTRDPRFCRRYFPTVPLIAPDKAE